MDLRRDIFIVLGAMALIFALILWLGPTSKITFLDLRVQNDTDRTVTIQPCWDLDCLVTNGLHAAVVRRGDSVHVTGHWPTNVGHEIVVGIRKPGGTRWQYSSCMVTAVAPGQKTAVVRVAHARPCFTATEP